MTEKEKVIKNAWIAEIGEEKYNEVKDLICKEGYLNNNGIDADLKEHDFVQKFSIEYYDNAWIRPKSLQGIETNNGWTCISDGLPEETGYYVVIDLSGNQQSRFIVITPETSLNYLNTSITHWRKKEVYSNPIY